MTKGKKIFTIGALSTITTLGAVSAIAIPLIRNAQKTTQTINAKYNNVLNFNKAKKSDKLETMYKEVQAYYGLNFKTKAEIKKLTNVGEKQMYEAANSFSEFWFSKRKDYDAVLIQKNSTDSSIINEYAIIFKPIKKDKDAPRNTSNSKWYDGQFYSKVDEFMIIDKRLKRKNKIIKTEFISGKIKTMPSAIKLVNSKDNGYAILLKKIQDESLNFTIDSVFLAFKDKLETLTKTLALPIIKPLLQNILSNVKFDAGYEINNTDIKDENITFTKNEKENFVEFGFKYKGVESGVRLNNFETTDSLNVKNEIKKFTIFNQHVKSVNLLEYPKKLKDGEVTAKQLTDLPGHQALPPIATGVTRKYKIKSVKDIGVTKVTVTITSGDVVKDAVYYIFGFDSASSDIYKNAILFNHKEVTLTSKEVPLVNGTISEETLEKLKGHPSFPSLSNGVVRKMTIDNDYEKGEATVNMIFEKNTAKYHLQYKIKGFQNNKELVQSEKANINAKLGNQVLTGNPDLLEERSVSVEELEKLKGHKNIPDAVASFVVRKFEFEFDDSPIGKAKIKVTVTAGLEENIFYYEITGFKKYTKADADKDVNAIKDQIADKAYIVIQDYKDLTNPAVALPNKDLIKYGIVMPEDMNGVTATFDFKAVGNIVKDGKYKIEITLIKKIGTSQIITSTVVKKEVEIEVSGVQNIKDSKMLDDYKKLMEQKTFQTQSKTFNSVVSMPSVQDVRATVNNLARIFWTLPTNKDKVLLSYSHGEISEDGEYEIIFKLEKGNAIAVIVKCKLIVSGLNQRLVDEDSTKFNNGVEFTSTQNVLNSPLAPEDGIVAEEFLNNLVGHDKIPAFSDNVIRLYKISTTNQGVATITLDIFKKNTTKKTVTWTINGFKKDQDAVNDDKAKFKDMNWEVENEPDALSVGDISKEALDSLIKDKKLPEEVEGIKRKYGVAVDIEKGTATITVTFTRNKTITTTTFEIKGFKKVSKQDANNDINEIKDKFKEGEGKLIDKAGIAASPAGTTDLIKLAKLGITMPANLKGVKVSYSHPKITTDGTTQSITIVLEKFPSTKKVTFTLKLNITGIQDAKDKEVLENYKKKIKTHATLTASGILYDVEDKSSNNITTDLGITLPTMPSGVTVTYSHKIMDKDGTLVVKLKLKKGNVEEIQEVLVSVSGIEDALIKKIKDNSEILYFKDGKSTGSFQTLDADLKTKSTVDIKAKFTKTNIPGYNIPTLNNWLVDKVVVENIDIANKKVTYMVTFKNKAKSNKIITKKITVEYS